MRYQLEHFVAQFQHSMARIEARIVSIQSHTLKQRLDTAYNAFEWFQSRGHEKRADNGYNHIGFIPNSQSNQTVPEWLDRGTISWRFDYTHRIKRNNRRTAIKKQRKKAESAASASERQHDNTATSSLAVLTPSQSHLPHGDEIQTDSASAQVELASSADRRSRAIFLCVLHPNMAQTPIIECPNVRKEADEGSFDMFGDGPMKEMVETYEKNFANCGGLGSFAHCVNHEERGDLNAAKTFRLDAQSNKIINPWRSDQERESEGGWELYVRT